MGAPQGDGSGASQPAQGPFFQMEFDADQLFHSPSQDASDFDAISSDQKCKLRGDADRADYLQRCSSLGLVTNETGNRAPAELNTPSFQTAPPI